MLFTVHGRAYPSAGDSFISTMPEGMQQFASAPQAVGGKYRDVGDGKNNIMHDKRVVRGNTYQKVQLQVGGSIEQKKEGPYPTPSSNEFKGV